MVVQSSAVKLQGSSSASTELVTGVSSSRGNLLVTPQGVGNRGDPGGVVLDLSQTGRMQSMEGARAGPLGGYSGDWRAELKRSLLEIMLDYMSKDGRPRRFTAPSAVEMSATNGQMSLSMQSVKMTRTLVMQNSMQFSAKAEVTTADGRSIQVDLELNMSQSFYQKVDVESMAARLMKDPLVINFGASTAGLQNTKMTFDLDADGQSDQISRLAAGSGFLAVDWNGDGAVTDGGELFGTKSGNGFADLAKHDGDGNGWIDENDAIYDKLRVWTHNDDGTASLYALGELGIGAIYTGSVATDYALGNLASPDGMIRRTGVFLFEDGRGGTVQHVDISV